MLPISLKYKPVTQSILCLTFLTHVATYTMFKLQWQEYERGKKMQFTILLTCNKQGQDHQTWSQLVELINSCTLMSCQPHRVTSG